MIDQLLSQLLTIQAFDLEQDETTFHSLTRKFNGKFTKSLGQVSKQIP